MPRVSLPFLVRLTLIALLASLPAFTVGATPPGPRPVVTVPEETEASGPRAPLWQVSTVDSGGSVGQHTSLALDGQERPHISYFGYTAAELKYAHFHGTSWNIETVASQGDVGRYNGLAIDGAGRPHISYLDNTVHDLVYARFNGTVWLTTTVDPDIEGYTSLVLNASDLPRIAYYGDNDDLYYAYHNGTGWISETVDSAGVVGLYPSLALDDAGRPHISYYRADTHTELKYGHYVAVGGNCGPSGSWECQTVDSADDVGEYSSLALDGDNRPHISYFDNSSDSLKYAYHDGTGWISETVDSGGNVGQYTSLALDGAGRPHISYYDAGNGDLKYAYHDGIDWTIVIVDSSVDVGQYTSLALDGAGRPHISYYDADQQDLKYAYLCTPIEHAFIEGPSFPQVGQPEVYAADFLPLTANSPVIALWNNGTVGFTATYSWAEPGPQTVRVTLTNPCSEITGVLPVTVCCPLQEVTVSGPADVLVGQSSLYTATYAPPGASQPVTLTWDNGAIGTSAAYSWTLPGHYTVTVTAANPCAQTRGTLGVTACSLIHDAGFHWAPFTPTIHVAVTFTGTVDSLLPVTFTWNVGGTGKVGRVITHVFTVTGTHLVTMTAANSCDEAVVERTVRVVGFSEAVYLPIVLKGWNPCFLSPAGFGEVEDNDSYAQANGPLCSDQEYYGYPDDADDYYLFHTEAGTVTVEMWDYAPEAYGQMLLYDAGGAQVGWDSNPYDGWSIRTSVEAGTYFIRIYTADGFAPGQAYTLRSVFPER